MIKAPMDLSSILNKLYMGKYLKAEDFWRDLGMVFKNSQAYYNDDSSDIRVCADTLR